MTLLLVLVLLAHPCSWLRGNRFLPDASTSHEPCCQVCRPSFRKLHKRCGCPERCFLPRLSHFSSLNTSVPCLWRLPREVAEVCLELDAGCAVIGRDGHLGGLAPPPFFVARPNAALYLALELRQLRHDGAKFLRVLGPHPGEAPQGVLVQLLPGRQRRPVSCGVQEQVHQHWHVQEHHVRLSFRGGGDEQGLERLKALEGHAEP
uniref:Putative secreted protein n=1 Tax=Ixodes ricinus TaxID=34613 RepID=A0A6B0V2N2_IXORI